MAKSKPQSSDAPAIKIITVNRKARHDYHILETFEAGIVLTGGEIKSVRQGEINLAQSYVTSYGAELFLVGAHINPYKFTSDPDYDPIRKRKLLLKKTELHKLISRVETKGLTIVPLQLHLKRGYAKLEIALAKGKDAPDKRQAIKGREAGREMARAIKGGKY